MDWLKQTTEYSDIDLRKFTFSAGEPFNVWTVTLVAKNGDIEHEVKKHHSESSFKEWVEKCSPSQDQPTFSVIIHERHNDKANSIPYSKEIFRTVSEKLCQHRSLTWSMQRTSTSIFNSTQTNWSVDGSNEQAIVWQLRSGHLRNSSSIYPLRFTTDTGQVYNCRSDTDTLKFNEDILISTTYFKSKPWVLSAIYGYPEDQAEDLVNRLKTYKEPAFHPLMMPMVFVENERGRFMEVMEIKSPKLEQRIMDLENRLQADEKPKKQQSREEIRKENQEMTKKDCDSAKLWDEVSRLRNGMESFRKVLVALEQQFETFNDLKLRSHIHNTDEEIVSSMSSENIKCRIREMSAEVDGNIRKCEGLLAGMALAIQVEWNYHTRRDAKANIFIARASHQDSTQMKMISWIGMIFLPGTFLATFFSMSFFQWIPDDSPQVISPWVCVYIGLTAIITGVIAWIWWQKTRHQPHLEDLLEYIGVEDVAEMGLNSRRKRSHDSGSSRDTVANEKDG